MPNKSVATGYWAGFRDAETAKYPFSSKVHSHRDGKPLCGYKPSPKAEFQFCAYGSADYAVDCPRCLRVLREAQE